MNLDILALICDRNDHGRDLFCMGTNFLNLYVQFRVLLSKQVSDRGGAASKVNKNLIPRTTYGQKLIFCNTHIGHYHDNF